MAPTTSSRLVLLGGAADLSFRDGSGAKRRVLPGVPFEVDADTAAILLGDPNVAVFVDPDEGSARDDPPVPEAPTAADLRARAESLGLTVKARDTKAELTAAIAAEETRLVKAAFAAAKAAAEASGSGEGETEAGTPPAATASATPGAIVLGDLPPGAKTGA